jgi:hypothetical protein
VKLKDVVEKVYIVAYRENTEKLEFALRKEGFSVAVVRPNYTMKELTYSQSTRVLINHLNAWRCCANHQGLTIIVEADFVPCKRMGESPLPFDITMMHHAWGWLYAVGPTIYELIKYQKKIYARGHAAGAVAIILGPEAAKIFVEFGERELFEKDPFSYSVWDTYIRMYAQQRGIYGFIAYRNYGEHGGVPNPEHKKAGLPSTNRSEVMMSALCFMPEYANNNILKYMMIRIYAKLRGVGRLLFFRFLEISTLRKATYSERYQLIKYAVVRLITLH